MTVNHFIETFFWSDSSHWIHLTCFCVCCCLRAQLSINWMNGIQALQSIWHFKLFSSDIWHHTNIWIYKQIFPANKSGKNFIFFHWPFATNLSYIFQLFNIHVLHYYPSKMLVFAFMSLGLFLAHESFVYKRWPCSRSVFNATTSMILFPKWMAQFQDHRFEWTSISNSKIMDKICVFEFNSNMVFMPNIVIFTENTGWASCPKRAEIMDRIENRTKKNLIPKKKQINWIKYGQFFNILESINLNWICIYVAQIQCLSNWPKSVVCFLICEPNIINWIEK